VDTGARLPARRRVLPAPDPLSVVRHTATQAFTKYPATPAEVEPLGEQFIAMIIAINREWERLCQSGGAELQRNLKRAMKRMIKGAELFVASLAHGYAPQLPCEGVTGTPCRMPPSVCNEKPPPVPMRQGCYLVRHQRRHTVDRVPKALHAAVARHWSTSACVPTRAETC